MKLTGADGAEFELNIVRYQFPESLHKHDGNWLIILIKVNMLSKQWQSIDPSLLTWEAGQLAEWLQAIGQSCVVDDEVDFLEPNLRFQLINENADGVTLHVYFELESRPLSARADRAGMNDLFVALQVSREQIREAAKSLRSELAKFPVRGSLI